MSDLIQNLPQTNEPMPTKEYALIHPLLAKRGGGVNTPSFHFQCVVIVALFALLASPAIAGLLAFIKQPYIRLLVQTAAFGALLYAFFYLRNK